MMNLASYSTRNYVPGGMVGGGGLEERCLWVSLKQDCDDNDRLWCTASGGQFNIFDYKTA